MHLESAVSWRGFGSGIRVDGEDASTEITEPNEDSRLRQKSLQKKILKKFFLCLQWKPSNWCKKVMYQITFFVAKQKHKKCFFFTLCNWRCLTHRALDASWFMLQLRVDIFHCDRIQVKSRHWLYANEFPMENKALSYVRPGDVWQDSQWFNNIHGLFSCAADALTTFQRSNVKCALERYRLMEFCRKITKWDLLECGQVEEWQKFTNSEVLGSNPEEIKWWNVLA